ncbi:D-ribose transporter ATP-binding protein [Petrotoga sp. HKA.pet.4.5]|uniref:sugar ABC transporter ATP-binding protein n=1 Tax=unclassified Petrotoga TaxID=2620614 RepID=UPI000EF16ECD|nr:MULTISPECIES: sugar ABC transporter ATP-binding protein [unclassified Petrotoga]RLL83960.1 D-ribose transporter ATP-binding protein [Petrotoga sp. Shatin.DS.tank11.9.2.9.3]RLL90416.1 D-ribose transporter ATP-binding protein [Petrotoga sp. HKA.pet.4.5]
MNPVLKVVDISKEFPGVKALDQVSIDFYPGEVHAIVGENGAGKSTLMKIIAGVYKQNGGKIIFKEIERYWKHPSEAIKEGIVTIFQELSVMDNLSVSENLFLGSEPKRGPFLNFGKLYKSAKEFLKEFDLNINPNDKLKKFTIGVQQMIEIARATYKESKVIIMDEPTSSLTQNEVAKLFEVIRNLKQKGVSIIFVSHRLEEIFETADKVSVLRDGKLVGTNNISDLNRDKIVEMMVGRKIENFYIKKEHQIGKPIMKVENLSGEGFENVSFEVHEGEVLGFSGLIGAGRSEIMETIIGLRKKKSGNIYVDNKEVTINNPLDAVKLGIGMVPEDRKRKGLILIHSVKDNISLPSLDKLKRFRIFVNEKAEKELSKWAIDSFNIKTPSPTRRVKYLSGGNQQKVVVAKWIALKPKILILDEPTRGIDVGAKAEIYELISDLAQQGMAIIMISSELPEVLQISDRIAVMAYGHLTGVLNAKEASQEKVMKLATQKEKVYA